MRILNSNEVVKKIGLSKVTVWRMERAGLFPKRINLSDRRVGWAESEIEDGKGKKKTIQNPNGEYL